jgi:3-keto-disaccharide hydrolase
VNVPLHGNSGVYLRGIYEVQVADTYGRPLDSHNMAGVYSRITPTASAEKPAGQWQTMNITLLDRHVTVELNGQRILDNQPLLGCTGGALSSDEFRPGPIYLQGDHTAVSYRSIVLTPIIK